MPARATLAKLLQRNAWDLIVLRDMERTGLTLSCSTELTKKVSIIRVL